MKKAISVALCFVVVCAFWGCSGKEKELTTFPEQTTADISARELEERINSSTIINEENLLPESKMINRGAQGGGLLTGLFPLPEISYVATEKPDGLSETKCSHSHGPSVGGEPHHTVVEFQKSFERFGAVTLDTEGENKAIYLTFDCGYENNGLTGKVLDTLKEKGVSAAFFCTLDYLEAEPELVARMIKENHIVANHSSTHPSFPDITRDKMAKELEDFENYLRKNFGYASKYFRFPAGEYSESALQLVQSLGYKSVFWSAAYDDWDTNNIRGKDYAVEKVLSRLHSGAIILLHSVSPDNAAALGEIIDKARQDGYKFCSLTQLEG